MEDVELWNVLLLLCIGKEVIKVLEFIHFPQEIIHVLHRSYIFKSQRKERDHEVKIHKKMVIKVKSYGFVIVILCHLPNSTLEANIAVGHEIIEAIYNEPNN